MEIYFKNIRLYEDFSRDDNRNNKIREEIKEEIKSRNKREVVNRYRGNYIEEWKSDEIDKR